MRMSNLDLSLDFEGLTPLLAGQGPRRTQSLGPSSKGSTARPGNDDLRDNLPRRGLPRDAGAGHARSSAGIIERRRSPTSCARTRPSGSVSRTTPRACACSSGRPSRTVRKRSAKGRSSPSARSSCPAAVDEIIALARGAEKKDVRKQAVFWLGQMASEKSGRALEEIRLGRTATSRSRNRPSSPCPQLPDDQGVDALIKLAKTHPDPRHPQEGGLLAGRMRRSPGPRGPRSPSSRATRRARTGGPPALRAGSSCRRPPSGCRRAGARALSSGSERSDLDALPREAADEGPATPGRRRPAGRRGVARGG
ncbi:MAG: hypothetical protein MZW92_68515 [Comamonadaceae bacterium]|nr:hypothetical protein [Comamonadaceae bacterium]